MTDSKQSQRVNLQGNHACAMGAIAAGCRFYAGYPITPSSEIAERMSVELPGVEGIFVQMEDEIASMGAILGASMGGLKVMTATSGPGFSLKQENLGYAVGAEIPCVVVNVMRGGPSTGLPTRPAQGDIMQARWGTHGDHPALVLAPASVPEIYEQTIRAFNLAETLRMPVVILYDESIGHLSETVSLKNRENLDIQNRKWATEPTEDFLPYAVGEDQIPDMVRPGDGFRSHTTGLTHAPDGFPTQEPAIVDAYMQRLLGKLDHHNAQVESFELLDVDDADILVIAYGISSRAARRAIKMARAEGIKVGMFRPVTVWPFPATALKAILPGIRSLLIPEMNAGQLIHEVERYTDARHTVEGLNRIDGEAIAPNEILDRIRELAASE
ncbi:MAG: 2-oxoacid:acceptor oxidoreductase subunit alpha [Halieaceae bacterium]|jgi:2-oxoglutarate/2-oxoacid ferredoxin oxidoreductase subunit alpha|nr:2-oxoacid:acceptor oxidoreductase subunit alpha [Halieaceae bacterium]